VDYQGSELPFAGRLEDWNERWLDIRELDLLQPIMKARLELAASKQCDGVEPDNMDAYINGDETGISLAPEDQLTYNKWIAQTAHSLGLSVGLKNDLGQLRELIDDFDFAVNEQCFEYDECSSYSGSFIAADKAVFGVEYGGSICRFCPEAESLQLSWMKKKLLLGSYRRGCTDFWTRLLC
jgi:Glycoside-hydrolase family GH114